MGYLPIAVEVRLWLADPTVLASAEVARLGTAGIVANSREFRQMIYLPTARLPDMTTATATDATGAAAGTTTGGF